MGDYAAAETHAELGIATYDPARHHSLTYAYSGHDPGVCCRAFSAMTLLLRGFPDQALDRCRETLALAEREAHPLTLALAQWAFSYVHLMRREPDAGRRWAEKEVALSEKYVLPLLLSQGQFQLGWALADQGQLTEGIAAMLEGLIAISATGAEMGMPYFLSILAEAHGRNGQVIEGVALVDRALAVASETGARFQLPELHRARGNLLLQQGQSKASAAEACFTQALQVAREQAVKFPELHAARDLAALWIGQGALQKAHDVLTPVYAWFTEGFDTPDLQAAEALLNELHA
jgi:predicted ATPase